MLFFDLEAYVPPSEREPGRSSLVVNPTRPGHVLLGGCFFSKGFSDPIPEAPVLQGLWLWEHASEAELLRAILARFEEAWRSQERIKILGKPTTDLVVCGAGIAKFDLPALFCRAHLHGLADPAELYEVFLKTRPIDLANEASFLFPEEPVLYPKTTREMAGRLGLRERKGSSKGVWELYEQQDHAAIEQRTAAELLTVLDIYRHLQQRISRRR
ncbi:hypothetical protein [Hyalangium gracile]|uniref:hypothetical protein n=1 Tax=Hyalangium gracile TaxID=394092 RepID=UPI001CC910F5|nr:hypothetical protein [Hyalangium gracile]